MSAGGPRGVACVRAFARAYAACLQFCLFCCVLPALFCLFHLYLPTLARLPRPSLPRAAAAAACPPIPPAARASPAAAGCAPRRSFQRAALLRVSRIAFVPICCRLLLRSPGWLLPSPSCPAAAPFLLPVLPSFLLYALPCAPALLYLPIRALPPRLLRRTCAPARLFTTYLPRHHHCTMPTYHISAHPHLPSAVYPPTRSPRALPPV